MTHIDELDAKPEPRINGFWHGVARALWLWWRRAWHGQTGDSAWDDPDGNTNWERFECKACYGPGFESGSEARDG
jgi:hypothetical protein